MDKVCCPEGVMNSHLLSNTTKTGDKCQHHEPLGSGNDLALAQYMECPHPEKLIVQHN